MKFTNTILQNIFSVLERKHINGEKDSLRTLYYCSLVNREWNQNAIPYLWSSPFHTRTKISSDYTSSSPENSGLATNLINIYLECLDNHSLGILKEYQILSAEKTRSNSLLHNYLKFLKYLDLRGLVHYIGIWLSNYTTEKSFVFPYLIRKAQLVVLKELIRNALENGAELNELRIDTAHVNYLLSRATLGSFCCGSKVQKS
ncbi:9481_t:CDS:2, partial [Ambispora leptoticha]